MSCKVNECRFSDSHVTNGHQCGTCKQLGHGQLECADEEAKQALYEATKDDELKVADRCKSIDCKTPKYHKNHAHFCSKCKSFHILQLCPQYNKKKKSSTVSILYSVSCPNCRIISIITTANEPALHIHTDAQCSICADREVNICLPCKCAKICNTCLDSIKKTD